jgi:osmoprotectant transport system substrate-binding protein
MTANPQIRDLFAAVSRKLDDRTLVTLNARIDVDGQDPGEVALSWLVSQGFVTRP